ncbi:MAG: FtsW/RodA/SpoVE family cell cycle protein [Prevotellaceae bacterium]|nr:FtsW/RodA/SpoVE family cell cycle protein [Prevotella sp.]MDD7257463.1 FtsW/RodA/SpoVE family cell cycle protein [Prevotellaceae bacterium]MDY6130902.1 FtsW/RodA/SpoVE family cell cycle protein [Prevotella sp.]
MFDSLSRIKMKGDGIIWMVFFFLCIISVLEVYSASSALTYKAGSYWKPVAYHTFLLIFGVGFMIVTMNIKCKYFKIVTPFALLFSFLMLVVVLIVGQSTNGAQRWIEVFGIQFQPSELAKGAVILAEAQILSAMQTVDGADRRACKYILGVSVPFLLLIAIENLSTAALLLFTVMLLMFIGRVRNRQLGKLLGFLALMAVFAFSMVMLVGKDEAKDAMQEDRKELTEQMEGKKKEKNFVDKIFHRADTWKARIDKFLDSKELSPQDIDLDKDAQVAHANIAIASSNIVGKGPGNSVERDFLSQAFSDFIYAIIIEEMGIWGAFGVCLLYIILLFRTATIANRCANAFPALLVMGIALLLVTQAMFNMAVAVGLAPVTGQPLPLVSKGGTSTIVNCVYIGVILSVSYTAKKKEELAENASKI